jgi:glyoxylase-like metal-dependent hydrolase (beta-lactamase superfamily II)
MLHASSHGPITRIRLTPTLLGRPLHEVSAYLVGGLLIDSGPPRTAGELLAWLWETGEAGRLTAVVHTHHHEDHVGGSPLLARELGVPVFAPEPTVRLLARKRRLPPYRAAVWGNPGACPARVLPDPFEAGGLRLSMIPTPGHAFDHVALFDAGRRWLFSGDLFVHERVRYLRRVERPWEHLASLRRVLALEPELLICAHAGLIEDAQGALARKIAFWEALAGEARALAAAGHSVRAITRRLLGREDLYRVVSAGDFSKANLVRALLAGP